MADQDTKRATRESTSADTRSEQPSEGTTIDELAENARDREMGRAAAPLGDLGSGHRTWTPPSGEQGISNRPDDAAATDDRGRTMAQDTKKQGGQQNSQQAGQQSGQREGGGKQAGFQQQGQQEGGQRRGASDGESRGNQTSSGKSGGKQGGSGTSQTKGDDERGRESGSDRNG